MEQKKIEHITLHLIVFGTIAIIGVLARQTVLHYGWDEFSSYLILVVCSIVIGAIYINLTNGIQTTPFPNNRKMLYEI